MSSSKVKLLMRVVFLPSLVLIALSSAQLQRLRKRISKRSREGSVREEKE